jgi:undecaprenyl-diphosphatase
MPVVDQRWLFFLNGLPAHTPGLGPVAVLLAGYGIFLYPALLIWLWWRKPDARRVLLLAVGAAALALAANAVVGRAVARPRPFLIHPLHVLLPSPARDPSFPSDHAAVSSAIAAVLFWGGETGWGAAAFLGAVLIGTARIVVGVHYPSDIVGGLAVGLVCGAVARRAGGPLRPVLDTLLRIARRLHLA